MQNYVCTFFVVGFFSQQPYMDRIACYKKGNKQSAIIACFSFVREKVTTCAQTDWQ